MRASTAYFAGAGTVVMAIVAGVKRAVESASSSVASNGSRSAGKGSNKN